jgi:hypothetical protein
MKNAYHTNLNKFYNNKNKIKMVTERSSNCSVTAKFFPMLFETPYSGGFINLKKIKNKNKNKKNYEPTGFCKKKSCKMSKN